MYVRQVPRPALKTLAYLDFKAVTQGASVTVGGGAATEDSTAS